MGFMVTMTPHTSDDELAALMRSIAVERDRAAFATLFDLYAPKLKAFLAHGGLEHAVAEELVQEVMLTVWRRGDTYDPRQGGLSAWLFTIARNRRIDYFRRTQRPPGDEVDPTLLPEPEPSAEGLFAARQSQISVRAALGILPDEQAEVLRMAFFEQKSHSVIAAEQGLPLGTVKSRIRLALRQLRRTLEAEQ